MTALQLYALAETYVARGYFALARKLYEAGDELTTIEAGERELEGEWTQLSERDFRERETLPAPESH